MAPSKKKQLKAKKVEQFDTSNFRLGKYKSNPRTREGRYCLKLVSENPQNVSAYSMQTGESERYLKRQAKIYKENKPFRNVGESGSRDPDSMRFTDYQKIRPASGL